MVEQVGGNVAWCALHIPAVFNSSSKAAVITAVLFEDKTSRPKAAADVVALVVNIHPAPMGDKLSRRRRVRAYESAEMD